MTTPLTNTGGDGSYTLTDADTQSSASFNSNTFRFTDANLSDLRVSRSGNDMILTLGTESIRLVNQLAASTFDERFNGIETFRFANGQVATEAELRTKMFSDMKASGTVFGAAPRQLDRPGH